MPTFQTTLWSLIAGGGILLGLAGCQKEADYVPISESSLADPDEESVKPQTAPVTSSATTSEPQTPVAVSDSAATSEKMEPSAAESPAMSATQASSASPAPESSSASSTAPKPATPAPGSAPEPEAPSGPRKIQLLVPTRELAREGKSQAIRISFDDLDLLKVCNMDPVPPDVMDYLPDWLKNLHGQKVILRGWMFPSGRQDGITSFMFVRDNGICCFGRDPKVYDKLGVTMQPGKTTRYIEGRPFDVEATLFIEPDIEGDDEGFWWLYRMEDAKVIDQ